MNTTHIERKKKALVEKRERLIGQFSEAARTRKKTARICTEIRTANDFLASLDQILAENTSDPAGPRRYSVSSLFLYESYKKLTADQDEQFFFVTGPEVEGVHVLDQWAEFEHQRRCRVGVVADLPSTHNLLIRLEQFGHKFLAHFHSHPCNGPGGTSPSGTDQNFQKRLESAGHMAVMAIFSRDGFIRFIRLDQNLDIEIYGEGVEKHAPGKPIEGAEDRQRKIPGFDQAVFSKSKVLCIGAGGIVSQIAPTLARKGIGAITLVDDDLVEASNLNRQRFYERDIGKNKAVALAGNLQRECIAATEIRGIPLRFEQAVARGTDLSCNVAVCGVDNNPARVAVCRYFRARAVPVIFTAVSLDGDHGYVFVQDSAGPCLACLFPDMCNDDRYPCPGTPAIADILQAVGALAVYAIDSLLVNRSRLWNYRRISLADGSNDGGALVPERAGCPMCAPNPR